MLMHHLIIFVIEKSFDLPILQFADDIQNNLRKELDFRIESSNAKLAEKNFKLLSKNALIQKGSSFTFQT